MRTYMRSGALKALLKSVECYEVNSPVPLQTGGRLVLFSTREQLQRSSSLVLFFFSFKFSLLSLSLSLSLPLLFHISLPCFINCSSAALSFWTSRYCAIVAAKAEMVFGYATCSIPNSRHASRMIGAIEGRCAWLMEGKR